MKRETLIQPTHLERLALVYVRQSTPGQVLENRESTRLQYCYLSHYLARKWAVFVKLDDSR